jgi:hypothetical protein
MKRQLIPSVIIIAMFSFGAVVGAQDPPAASKEQTPHIELVGAKRNMALHGDESQKKAKLEMGEFKATYKDGSQQTLQCYELTLEGDKQLRIWSSRSGGLGDFHIFEGQGTSRFLVWIYERSVCVLEILHEKDYAVLPSKNVSPISQADVVVDLSRFEGDYDFWGTRADRYELEILSVQKADKPSMNIKVKNVFGKICDLIKENGEWAAIVEGKPLRRKP